jgi:soluble lytic murein transglycosylase
MKLGTLLSACSLLACLSAPLVAQDADRAFLDAREAFRVGDRAKLERASATLSQSDLAIYGEYWLLRQGLERADPIAVKSFLNRWDGEYLAEKLRGEWLKEIAKRGEWAAFMAEYPNLAAPDQELACGALQARLARGDTGVYDEARRLWLTLPDPPALCQPLFASLVQLGNLRVDDVWARARRQFEAGKTAQARSTLHFLPLAQDPDDKTFALVVDKPAPWLARLPAGWSDVATTRQLAALAVQRLATNDPAFAAGQLESLEGNLPVDVRQWAWGQIGWQAARRHMNEASGWYARGAPAQLSEETHGWWVRSALLQQDWGTVRRAIESMPPELASRPEWIYWLGRAYKAGGRQQDAQSLFARIAGQPDFYGTLASEELGRLLALPPRAQSVSREELLAAQARPGLRRALILFRLDLRTEAVREWNWALRGMNDRELLAAAELARQNDLYDRAINTAEKTRSEHDFSLRYLAPYGDQVRPAARNQSLDDAWVYGLMRQESRFVSSAKSNVGASGLMQLMPATAKWVARKIGLKDYQPSAVHDPDTNLLLGTSYMRMVLENLDNHPVLASAAYNAGPGRAQRWRADVPVEGAIYAETIPFSETRDYVKKVMNNSIYYSVLFNGRPESLHERLGTIPPRNAAGAQKVEDLP